MSFIYWSILFISIYKYFKCFKKVNFETAVPNPLRCSARPTTKTVTTWPENALIKLQDCFKQTNSQMDCYNSQERYWTMSSSASFKGYLYHYHYSWKSTSKYWYRIKWENVHTAHPYFVSAVITLKSLLL